MAWIENWIRNLAYFLIFGAVVGIILPSKKYKEYIELCLGLVLVIMLMGPITRLIGSRGIPINDFFAGLEQRMDDSSLPDDSQYRELQQQMLQQSFDEQAATQLKAILSKEGFELVSVNVQASEDYSQITGIWLTIATQSNSTDRPFVYVEPVQPYASDAEDSAEVTKLKKSISGFYNMSIDNIHITVENE
jgi:stage III sporulation protein AF